MGSLYDEPRDYAIVSSFLSDAPAGERTWVHEEELVTGSYYTAGRAASRKAHALDEKIGTEHFWTVTLKNAETRGEYFQLFHGRLS